MISCLQGKLASNVQRSVNIVNESGRLCFGQHVFLVRLHCDLFECYFFSQHAATEAKQVDKNKKKEKPEKNRGTGGVGEVNHWRHLHWLVPITCCNVRLYT